jgi:hypothetical protein
MLQTLAMVKNFNEVQGIKRGELVGLFTDPHTGVIVSVNEWFHYSVFCQICIDPLAF